MLVSVETDYHHQLQTYGLLIKQIHHARTSAPPLMGWWSWTAFYFGLNKGTAGGVVFVPAFTGLGAPYWDSYAGGLIIGIHVAQRLATSRGAIESIAFQVADRLGAMDQDAKYWLKELRVDGGAAANDLLLQFQADLLGIPMQHSAVLETAALGAAYLAGLASGFWPDIETIAKNRVEGASFTPKADRAIMNKLRAKPR